MRRLRVLEFDPFVFDLALGNSRCVRIIAAFIARLDLDFLLLMTTTAGPVNL